MSNFLFKMPDIGEGVTEGEIVEWHVKLGDVVAEDDPMVEVMTDKATVTIGAPAAGTIAAIHFDVGAVAQVGQVIVEIAASGSVATAPKAAPKAEEKDEGPAATAVGDIREGLPGTSFFKTGGNGAHAPASASSSASASASTSASAKPKPRARAAGGGLQQIDFFQARPLATPATRKLARDLGVDLRRIPPTGPQGRTTRADVKGFVSSVGAQTPAAQPVARTRVEPKRGEERKPFVGIRRKIAQRMQMTKNTAAHFTFVEECDVTELIRVRKRLKSAAAEQGVNLSFLPFIVKAVVASLKKHPILNSALDESSNELVYRYDYDIGIAAATDAGLMVPVVRDADRLSLLDVAREIERLGEGARTGTLTKEELTGSTFTITSLGKQGGLFATPILNHPEVGILGVHQMKRKPVVRPNAEGRDEIVIGDVMLLSLSFDHRIVDGHVGAAFAYDVIAYLEQPERLMLEMA